MSARRVVITGLGCVSSLGATANELWENMRAGRSGIRKLEEWHEFPAMVFAPVTTPSSVLMGDIAPELQEKLTRPMQMFFSAVREALGHSKLLGQRNIGLIAGTTANYPVEVEPAEIAKYYAASRDGEIDWAKVSYSPHNMLRHMTNLLTCFPAQHFGLSGINETVHNACASGTQAVGAAFRLIKHGKADVILAGGADALVSFSGVTALAKLGVLSPNRDPETACRPFCIGRDGLVLGEGAAVLAVESLESAERRGAAILAEIVGFGSTGNAYRITDSPVEGRAAGAAITAALREAHLEPDAIGAISAHATSTPQNDLAEANAIKLALGEAAKHVPVMAPKALLGHTLSGAGAVELVAAVRALATGFLPGAPSYRAPDPECDLAVVGPESKQVSIRYLLKNSFGFGGQNGALILEKFAGDDSR